MIGDSIGNPRLLSIPSLGAACPRAKCGMKMAKTSKEHMDVWSCPECGYEVVETNTEMRRAYMQHSANQLIIERIIGQVEGKAWPR